MNLRGNRRLVPQRISAHQRAAYVNRVVRRRVVFPAEVAPDERRLLTTKIRNFYEIIGTTERC